MCKWNATALSLSWHRLQLPLVASQFTVANLGDTLADGNAKNTFICLLANFVQLGLLSKGHMKRILDKMASPELMQID